MLRPRVNSPRLLAGIAALAALAAAGCGSGVETVSPQMGRSVQSAVLQVEQLARSGCRVEGGDAGTVVHDATKTLVTAASRHPGSLVAGVPISQVIHKAAAPARQCGYTAEAQRISLAAFSAARQGG